MKLFLILNSFFIICLSIYGGAVNAYMSCKACNGAVCVNYGMPPIDPDTGFIGDCPAPSYMQAICSPPCY